MRAPGGGILGAGRQAHRHRALRPNRLAAVEQGSIPVKLGPIFTAGQAQIGGACENGSLDPTKNRLTATCGILGPDRYVVRLYTNNSATDYDNTNQYTLLVASQ